MYRILFLLMLVLYGVGGQGNCPPQQVTITCQSTAMFMFDATNKLKKQARTDEMNFAWRNLLPRTSLGFGQSVVFLEYGAGEVSQPLTTSYATACPQLFNLKEDIDMDGGQTTTVTSALQSFYSHYLDYVATSPILVLFSATLDMSDISNAAAFARAKMPKVRYMMVSIDGFADLWKGFPYEQLFIVASSTFPDNEVLATCLIQASCGIPSECDVSEWTTPAPSTSSTTMRSTPKPITVTTTTTTGRPATSRLPSSPSRLPPSAPTTPPSSTVPPSPSPNIDGPPCVCQYDSVWLDIIFLFDTSSSTGQQGLQELLGFVQTAFAWFNVQKTDTTQLMHSRIGIITYASNASLFAPLGSIDNHGLASIVSLPYDGDEADTNIEAAIQLALSQFRSPAHRTNARKVIVVLATSYNPGGVYAPQMIASGFKGDNGILIVYNYVQAHGVVAPVLQEIASPGYFLRNTDDNSDELMKQAMCDANCYCPKNYNPYTWDSVSKVPQSGCYYAAEIQGNFAVANNKCGLFNQGYLAQGKTLDKTKFLEYQFFSTTNFWAGLRWDTISRQWTWSHGGMLTPSSYQPWYQNTTHSAGMDCVAVKAVGTTLQWVPTDCRNGYMYVCEAPACDSVRYCTEVE